METLQDIRIHRASLTKAQHVVSKIMSTPTRCGDAVALASAAKTLTTQPVFNAGQTNDAAHKPEFVDARGAYSLFNISRTTLWRLAQEGLIRSTKLRVRGSARGRRLYDCDSIRALFSNN